MSTGTTESRSTDPLDVWIAIALVLVTYLASNIADAILEGESFLRQIVSPTHLFLLAFLLLSVGYVLRLVDQQRRLKDLLSQHLAAVESSADGCQLELERRTRELTASNKELETFSYTLSHDMRSYITCVSSAAQMLQDQYGKKMDRDGLFVIDSIYKASEDMEHLVESIQLMTSISRSEISRERVNLSEVVLAITAQLQMSEPERPVEFVVAPNLFATCDAKLAKVALDNLLGNAWKYTGTGAQARIEFGEESVGGKRVFFVRDNGVGFEMDNAGRLFEPFQRLKNARSFPGTGIGLATVQRVIQLHKGELWGVGEPGQGATFYFSLAPETADNVEAA